MSSGAVGAVRPMVGSAVGPCSIGSGGAITNWEDFDAWARSAEATEVVDTIEAKLAEVEAAPEHPFEERGWAAIELLVELFGALIPALPDAVRWTMAVASGRAGRLIREGQDSLEARLAARAELERPLRDLVARIRAAATPAIDLRERAAQHISATEAERTTPRAGSRWSEPRALLALHREYDEQFPGTAKLSDRVRALDFDARELVDAARARGVSDKAIVLALLEAAAVFQAFAPDAAAERLANLVLGFMRGEVRRENLDAHVQAALDADAGATVEATAWVGHLALRVGTLDASPAALGLEAVELFRHGAADVESDARARWATTCALDALERVLDGRHGPEGAVRPVACALVPASLPTVYAAEAA